MLTFHNWKDIDMIANIHCKQKSKCVFKNKYFSLQVPYKAGP